MAVLLRAQWRKLTSWSNGVVLGEESGRIPGRIELHTIHDQGTSKEALVGDSSAMQPEDVDSVFEAAQQRLKVTPVTQRGSADGQPKTVKHKHPK